MRTSFRLTITSLTFLLFFPAIASCSVLQMTHRQELIRKAVILTTEACKIYPAMTDSDECVDRVVRSILASRGVALERQDEIIAEQKANAAANHPVTSGGTKSSHEVELGHKLRDIIGVACATEPVITDLDRCMDKAYHAILSSRDPHSAYLNKEEAEEFTRSMRSELQGIGAEVSLTEDNAVGVVHVIASSPAEKAGVKDGDRIIAIVNGDEYTLTAALSNVDEVVRKIRGKPNTSVTLKILRGEKDEPITITVVRAAITLPMVKTEILATPNDPKTTYAYARLVHFGDAFRKKMVDAVNGILARHNDVKGIIFDVRGNPGGSLNEVYEAVDALADSPDALVSIRDNNGIHAYGTVSSERAPKPQPGDITNGLSCAVFVDRGSASAAEIFAGTLKELGRCVIIGTGTWRKGSVQSVNQFVSGPFDLFGDGSYVKTTGSEYVIGSPTKYVAVQCVGVHPDIAYEAEVAFKPKKEKHECDLPGAIVSGGARSDGNPIKPPLLERDPPLYHFGEQAREVVRAFDQKTFTKNEQIRKRLKLKAPKDESEEK